MKYLVMEIHPAYAVLLDEQGRYLKAANLHYQVGDTVKDIIPLRERTPKALKLGKPFAGLAAMAACFCLVFFGYYQPNFTAYGTLRIQINPDVEMTISRTERVLELEALNQDGMALITGYDYQGKRRDTTTDELVERAIDMGYLSDGDTISITVSSQDAAWQAKEEAQTRQALEERYGEQVVIRIGGGDDNDADRPPEEKTPQEVEVVIPVTTQTPSPAQPGSGTNTGADGVTDYSDTDYGPNADGVTDYHDPDPDSAGVTDYADTDYGPNADGVTDYNDPDPDSTGVTNYADTDYGPNADGVTDYSNGVTDYADRGSPPDRDDDPDDDDTADDDTVDDDTADDDTVDDDAADDEDS